MFAEKAAEKFFLCRFFYREGACWKKFHVKLLNGSRSKGGERDQRHKNKREEQTGKSERPEEKSKKNFAQKFFRAGEKRLCSSRLEQTAEGSLTAALTQKTAALL